MTYTNSPTYIDSVDTVVYAEALNEGNVVYTEVLIPGVPGMTAYELAVQEGFVGTLTQWLDSLNAASIVAGAGMTSSGSTINVISTGGGSLNVTADSVNLPAVGTAGTYSTLTTDAYGRVTAGTSEMIRTPVAGSPSTLSRAVYGLLDWRINASQTGAIVLYAPSGLASVVHQLEIAADAYASSKSTAHLTVNGFRGTGAWSSTYKLSTGSLDLMARWAVAPDGKNCLILGDVSDSWSNFHLSVVRAHFSGTTITDNTYSTGWTVGVVSDLSSFTQLTSALPNQFVENLPFRLGGSSTGSIIGDVSPGSSHATGRTVYNLATYHASNATLTGAIVFAAPTTTTNIMHWMEIQGYNYTTNTVINLSIGGYRSSGAWVNTSKVDNGNVEVLVRWGVTPGGNNCLILGDVTTVWVHPHISIARALLSYAGITDAYCAQWTVSVVTDLSAYTQVTAKIQSAPLKLGGSSTASVITEPSTGSQSTLARSAYNIAEYRNGSSPTTGAIVFSAGAAVATAMQRFDISGLIHSVGAVDFTVQGYFTSGAWQTASSFKVNRGTFDVPVRFGIDPNGRNCLILGDTTTAWTIPHIGIVRAMFSHTNITSDAYCQDWTVALATDLSTYTGVTGYIADDANSGFKEAAICATTADVAASTFSAGVLTGFSATVNLNVTTTLSSTTATTTSTAGLKVGAVISGNANIPAATTVASITNATTFVLSAAATAAGTAVATTFTQTIAAFTADGTTPARWDLVLVKNQTLPAQNGLYQLVVLGSASVAWVLQRVAGASTARTLAGAVVVIRFGTVHGGQEWTTDFKATDTINTTACNWYRLVDSRGVFDQAGAASTPGASIVGTWFSGGTATTTKPKFLIEPTGTTSTGWSTSGTGFGVNAPSGFTGRLLDMQLNGTSVLHVTSGGSVGINGAPSNTAGFSQQFEMGGSLPCFTLNNTGTGSGKYAFGINSSGNFGVWDNTNSSYRIVVDGTGRVGFGATPVARNVEVRDTSVTAALRIHSGTVSTNTSTSILELVGSFSGSAVVGTAQVSANVPAGGQSELAFLTSPSGNAPVERARIDLTGRQLLGHTASINFAGIGLLSQVTSAAAATRGQLVSYFQADASGPILALCKSRSSTLGTHLYPNSGDTLGAITFGGSNEASSRFDSYANISGLATETWTASARGAELRLTTTPNTTSTPAEAWRVTHDAVIARSQAAPAAVNATATLTIANLKAGIITSTSAAATDMTLPSGTLSEGGFTGIYTNLSFEWSVINTGPSLVRVLSPGADHTIVGSGNVATGTSARFASRRTAANTFVTYRLT